MGTVLVTGGSGMFGQRLVPLLEDLGHDVRVLSRRPGTGTHRGDLTTGDGVAAAAAGATAVVHAASDTRRLGRADRRQTATLLQALRAEGSARHLLYLSIVGVDVLPFRYYRQKLACESLVAAGGVPWTVLRATQFHELLAEVLRRIERLPVAPLPLDFRCQPVAAADVAARVATLLDGPPGGRAPDAGGPAVRTVGELAAAWREARGRPRSLVNLPVPGAGARGFREGRNTCPDRAVGTRTWEQFVAALPRPPVRGEQGG